MTAPVPRPSRRARLLKSRNLRVILAGTSALVLLGGIFASGVTTRTDVDRIAFPSADQTAGDAVGLDDDVNAAIDRDHHLYVALSASAGAQRIPRLEMPNSPGRASILGALVQHGPRSPAQLARLVGVDRTTIRHHARVLERNGFLRIVNDGRRTALMLPNQEPVSQAPAPVTSTRIMRLVSEAGGTITRTELHRLMNNAARRSVNHAIQSLVSTRRLERTQVRGFDALTITQESTKLSPRLAQKLGTGSTLAEHAYFPRPASMARRFVQ